jgi:hypothetical protein
VHSGGGYPVLRQARCKPTTRFAFNEKNPAVNSDYAEGFATFSMRREAHETQAYWYQDILTFACLIGATMLLPQVGRAQDENVKAAMQLLESMATNLGQPKIEGSDKVAGKDVPAIYFGSTKMNNNFELVDEVEK